MMTKYRFFFAWIFLFSCLVMQANRKVPNMVLNDVNGKEVNFQELFQDSVPVVITFWSTICKPCMNELDAFTENYEDWQDEVDFKIVAVSTDDSRASSKVRALARGRGWPFTIVLDNNQKLMRAMNVSLVPQLFVFNKRGEMIYSHTGYMPGNEYEVFDILQQEAP